MKRLLALAAAGALFCTLPAFHTPAPNNGNGVAKVGVCHFNKAKSGVVISIPNSALKPHRQHGDCRISGYGGGRLSPGDPCTRRDCGPVLVPEPPKPPK